MRQETLHAVYPPGPDSEPPGDHAAPPRSRAMRRRIQVFAAVFGLSLLASQAYNFSRPAIYQANARVEITPAAQVTTTPLPTAPVVVARSGALAVPGTGVSTATVGAGTPAFLAEVQVLSSRPLLEKAVRALQQQGKFGGGGDADAAVQAAQAMLSVTPLEGTQVVQLQAQGGDAALTAQLINALLTAYADQQVSSGDASAQTGLDNARSEVKVIEAKVADKRRALEAFKQRADIVSGERDENESLARVKGLNTSLATATEREASAAGKVRALEQAASGQRATAAKDNPTVAAIEARLSQAREDWRALERQFTPQYLEMDPNARALKTRIANLEQQAEAERQKGNQSALADAREELSSAQATVQRLRQQLSEGRQGVQAFSRRFGDYQGLQTELNGLEQMQQAARQKLLALEAGEAGRKPHLQVLEPAVTPQSPAQPLYWRDAGLGLAASLLLGFGAVWFVEFFNRKEPVAPPPQPAPTVIVQQPWVAVPGQGGLAQLGGAPAPLGVLEHVPGSGASPGAGFGAGHHAAGSPPLLSAGLPRELEPAEVARLLAQAAPVAVPVLACLLCGLTPAEIAALRVAHVDGAAGLLRVPGESPRSLPLPAPLSGLPPPRLDETADTPLFAQPGGRALDADDVASAVTSSAYDAGLDQPQTITPEALRHTYIAHLVRQGLRFGELGTLAGRLNADTLNALAPLAPVGPRVGLDGVEKLLPALRG